MIPKEEICKLPSDENTAEKRADKLWKFFKKSENGETTRSKRKHASFNKRTTSFSLLDMGGKM